MTVSPLSLSAMRSDPIKTRRWCGERGRGGRARRCFFVQHAFGHRARRFFCFALSSQCHQTGETGRARAPWRALCSPPCSRGSPSMHVLTSLTGWRWVSERLSGLLGGPAHQRLCLHFFSKSKTSSKQAIHQAHASPLPKQRQKHRHSGPRPRTCAAPGRVVAPTGE